MASRMKINDQITVGPQPAEDELKQLREEGFQTVINFRTADEEDQPLSPHDEGEKIRELGLEYLHIPVSMQTMGPDVVDQFRAQFSDLPKPVFAHCKSGKRAGAMVMMHVACEEGMSGEQTLQKAREMGFECDRPELEQFVREYVDSHTGAKAS